MTNVEKQLLELKQSIQFSNKLLNEILENMKLMQKDIGLCTKSMTATNAQIMKESKTKQYQMMKMLVESKIKKGELK